MKHKYLVNRVFLFTILLIADFILVLVFSTFFSGLLELYAMGLAVVILLFLLGFFFRFILRPYKEIQKSMVLFSAGYTYDSLFELRHYFCRPEELMIHRFSEIINRSSLLDLSKKQAEYLALQNQINPHFLYNTLENIRGEALVAGLDNLADMTEAMAKFFRYSIYNVSHLVHLEDELLNVENYLHIQRYRFGDRLSFIVEVAPEDAEKAYHCCMPKMTLQPIVENAVYHGIEPKLGNGTLRIKVELTTDRIIITVSDNGIGMEQTRVDAMNHRFSMMSMEEIQQDQFTRTGIALINVNTRIKLLFGEIYGIHMFSSPQVGTDVVVTLPLNVKGLEADET